MQFAYLKTRVFHVHAIKQITSSTLLGKAIT